MGLLNGETPTSIWRVEKLPHQFYFVATISGNNALVLRTTSVLVKTYLRSVLDSSSKARDASEEFFRLSSQSSSCQRCADDFKKLDYFSPSSSPETEAGGVPILDFCCGSGQFTQDSLLQDFSLARHLDFSSPSQDNAFLKFSSSRHLDDATRPVTSFFVDAHCAVFSSGQFKYSCSF